MIFKHAILTHGGSSSDPQHSDGPLSAAKMGMDLLTNNLSALDAVVLAVKYLEDDPRFNAGVGSELRVDGHTMQLDASCMTCDGNFGAVACVENVKNPIELAQGVLLHSPHILLVGEGARIFAQQQQIVMQPLTRAENTNTQSESDSPSCDTVGAVAFDGTTFAAALSTGGLKNNALGRVGDTPLPGCGLFCGSMGAVACTGDGEFIALKILAREVYGWLEQGINPAIAVQKALSLFDDCVDVGLIVLTKSEFAASARKSMAWSHLTEI